MSKKITFIRSAVRPPQPWFIMRRGDLNDMFKSDPDEAGSMSAEGNDDAEPDQRNNEDDDDGIGMDMESANNDPDFHDEEVAFDDSHDNEKMKMDRFVKPSRRLFLRNKYVQRLKWRQFLTYTIDNYDKLRESARDEAHDRLAMYKINNKNEWI
ncbi:hypothetical protein SAMD00019534_083740 [Acytostelium subglobosum LB1]|uniref:hypothetical protein n=1 Tax=Acytostelium subglobosum LB1 TaxID=1410327 RepID=UPI000644C0FA|nr:hypothetical protein SAMD00019534_083740 [Acytostelium subglobosum LB1]GAM25199.1 hypothetical protein SAMD00019534_083740 [Acytostelium subglobosum LB1]|eukprot:XP_012751719.1 hypothetical protein SAMD00019534_083740 [Acytostelium subglobosum LB1]